MGLQVPLGLSGRFSSKFLSSLPEISPLANCNTGYHFLAKKKDCCCLYLADGNTQVRWWGLFSLKQTLQANLLREGLFMRVEDRIWPSRIRTLLRSPWTNQEWMVGN